MSEEILVNVTPMETRVAVVENGATQDIYIERSASRGVVGNIYTGKVQRVLPGMQAAFVDIGLERNSFIHMSDIVAGDTANGELIRDHLHEGKKIVVQVTKDPLGSKGARLTTQLSVSSRYLVYMPDGDHIGVSQRIDDPEERERLQGILAEAFAGEEGEGGGGYILAASHTIPHETPLENVFAMYEVAGVSKQEIFDRAAEIRRSQELEDRS